MKKGRWFHKKYGKNAFEGSYARGILEKYNKERIFILGGVRKSNPSHGIVLAFESHEAAKAQGWKYQK